MLSFFANTAVLVLDPVIVVAGALAGYLFHADMKKLAWGLLLFVFAGLTYCMARCASGNFRWWSGPASGRINCCRRVLPRL